MNKVTGIAILTTAEGQRITYTYSEIDETGTITKSNVKKSFVVVDAETQTIVDNLKAKVDTNLQASS